MSRLNNVCGTQNRLDEELDEGPIVSVLMPNGASLRSVHNRLQGNYFMSFRPRFIPILGSRLAPKVNNKEKEIPHTGPGSVLVVATAGFEPAT